jgi:hypothetical protein
MIRMSEKQKIKASATAKAGKNPGWYRWSIEYKDGKVIDKYNSKTEKNRYCTGLKTNVPLTGASKIKLSDPRDRDVKELSVPDGAVVFQRRRSWPIGGGIPYSGKSANVKIEVPEIMEGLVNDPKLGPVWRQCELDEASGEWRPPKGVRMKQFRLNKPHMITKTVWHYDYSQVWLVGWRRREADGSVTVKFLAVYPDGKVDVHNGWGEKPWLYEPEPWLDGEQV